jgi:hypothetical protein
MSGFFGNLMPACFLENVPVPFYSLHRYQDIHSPLNRSYKIGFPLDRGHYKC